MRRYVPLLIAGIALIVSGCRDSFAPPQSEPSPLATLVSVGDLSFSRIVSSSEGANATVIEFDFTPAAGSQQLGEFLLKWEDNSVCDVETSGYGHEYFRKACAAETETIRMTAKVWAEDGRTYVDFYPDIRFSPDRNVTLSVVREEIKGRRRLTRPMMLKYNIYYTHRIGDTRYYIDEAWFDPEQRTHYELDTGLVWREIRHFSGFVIRTGYDESPPVDPLGTSQ